MGTLQANFDRRETEVMSGMLKGSALSAVSFDHGDGNRPDLHNISTNADSANSTPARIQTSEIKNPKKKAIIRFLFEEKGIDTDIETPLDISANDLIVGLNSAYNLGVNVTDMSQCYLSCENPVALIKGKYLLCEYGIRDGSLVIYRRK